MDNKMLRSSFDVLRGVLYAIIVSVFMVLGLALAIKLFNLDNNAVAYTNQAIKILSMLVGIFIGTRDYKMGAAKGALTGLLYILLSTLVFMLLSGQSFSMTIFDVLIGVAVGLISGIITVNIKNK